MAKGKKQKPNSNTIAQNKRARHEYSIENTYDAGLVLEGWEVRSIREGRITLSESYVLLDKGEAFLYGAHITPLASASTHVRPDAIRRRKLLLHDRELARLFAAVDRQGYTVVPLNMYWSTKWVKVKIGLGKGKKMHDKRADLKEKDWNRDKLRVMKLNR